MRQQAGMHATAGAQPPLGAAAITVKERIAGWVDGAQPPAWTPITPQLQQELTDAPALTAEHEAQAKLLHRAGFNTLRQVHKSAEWKRVAAKLESPPATADALLDAAKTFAGDNIRDDVSSSKHGVALTSEGEATWRWFHELCQKANSHAASDCIVADCAWQPQHPIPAHLLQIILRPDILGDGAAIKEMTIAWAATRASYPNLMQALRSALPPDALFREVLRGGLHNVVLNTANTFRGDAADSRTCRWSRSQDA